MIPETLPRVGFSCWSIWLYCGWNPWMMYPKTHQLDHPDSHVGPLDDHPHEWLIIDHVSAWEKHEDTITLGNSRMAAVFQLIFPRLVGFLLNMQSCFLLLHKYASLYRRHEAAAIPNMSKTVQDYITMIHQHSPSQPISDHVWSSLIITPYQSSFNHREPLLRNLVPSESFSQPSQAPPRLQWHRYCQGAIDWRLCFRFVSHMFQKP